MANLEEDPRELCDVQTRDNQQLHLVVNAKHLQPGESTPVLTPADMDVRRTTAASTH